MRPGAMSSLAASIAIFIVSLLITTSVSAQSSTVGLINYDQSATTEGYTLFSPNQSTETYLIDMYGRLINSWSTPYTPGMSGYLLENGDLLRAGTGASGVGAGGIIQQYTWDGTLVWEYNYANADHLQHHDIEPLPNGHVLLLAWEYKSGAEAIAAGRDPSKITGNELWTEHIVEVAPTGPASGDIVWEWHTWDHLVQDFDSTQNNYGVVADHSELVDINFPGNNHQDWQHCNAIEYNPDLDQIVISVHSFSELWIIDHSTTTAEAASHSGGAHGIGGDILYRWGNPQAYDAGDASDQQFFGQHDTQWIKPGRPGAGHILVFNNGFGRPDGKYSSIDEIATPVDANGDYPRPAPGTPFGPSAPYWTYVADVPTSFYVMSMSGTQRLANGNTLICRALRGKFFEVTQDGDIVWEYQNPVNSQGALDQGDNPSGTGTFRCYRYAIDYAGLEGQDLTPESQLEIYPITVSDTRHLPADPVPSDSVIIKTVVDSDNQITNVQVHVDLGSGFSSYQMFDDGNHHDGSQHDRTYGIALPPVAGGTEAEYYISTSDVLGSTVFDPPLAPDVTYRFDVVGPGYLCGDPNDDQLANVTDAVYLIQFIFAGGPAPVVYEAGDANCDGLVNITDAVYLIQYIFAGGPAPCSECP